MNATDKATQIRLAQLSDVPAIRLLIRLACRELMTSDYSTRQVESMLRYALDIDRQLILDGTYYIAEYNGRIAGIGGWSFRPSFNGQLTQTPPSPRLYPGKDPAMVRLFFIHPDFARRGIGRLLMSTCEGAAQSAGFKSLELAATLTGAKLYLSCGFEVVTEFQNTLPDGVTVRGLRMQKQLPDLRTRPRGPQARRATA
jgi:GNAT superfamily N-acetyltransferase